MQNRLINTFRLCIKDDTNFLIKKYLQSQNCLECNIKNHPLSSPSNQTTSGIVTGAVISSQISFHIVHKR